MKKHIFKRIFAFVLAIVMVLPNMQTMTVQAEEAQKIAFEKVSAKSASGHGAELIKDGNTNTYWQSIPSGGDGSAPHYSLMYAHNRYIDITLDGIYDLSQIKVYNRVDGSYNNYYIYVSTDGINYDKIVSKTSNEAATAQGDSYSVSVEASHIRLNMAYNSNSYVTNLSEIEVYGVRTGNRQDDTTGIQVSDWLGSDWQKEWDRFEEDPEYAGTKILGEMKNLVGRVIGEEWQDDFVFELRGSLRDEKDIFEVTDGEDGKIVIRGNNGIALASGFNYYLKNYVNVDYNPLFGSNVTMKGIVPVGKTVVKEAQYDLRYALNFCTYSYTMAFWNWDEYEEFLDWAAMNGLNLVLDIVGQEEVLRQTFLEYGFTNEEIKDYICGPAYFAWFYMQNLYSVGGPLPDAWFEQRTELGRKIHDRMQTYGITPVLQGFSGQVPETFAQKNAGAQLAPVDSWPGHTRPTLLMTYVSEGQTDYFKQVSETFYAKQKNVFGDISDYYATDPFHEGGNVGSLDVATIYKTVQDEMIKSNPEAVWILQQWQDGLSDGVKISKLDTSHVLVLDLQSDMRQQNWPFENRKIPWLYCMLHNFGGRMGLDGEVPVIATDPMETYNNKNYMVGIGITPEALENGPVAYELFLEVLWSKDPINYNEWIDGYAKRRAGGESESLQEAWDILVETAYADKGVYYQGAAETVMNARPADSFKSASTWGHSGIYYDKAKLDEALLLLAENYEAFSASEACKYDLADVAEQVICNVAVEYHSRMVAAKNAKDVEEFRKLSIKFLELFDLSEQILSSTDEFLLGTWIEASRKMITDADDWTKDLFEFNARSLVTTWGGERAAGTGGLKDYSNRKWAGLTSDFYKERWSIWVRNRLAELEGRSKDAADQKAESNWFMWEYQWTNRKSDDENGKYAFPSIASNVDLGALARNIYQNYSYTALLREEGLGEEIVNALEGKVPVLTGTTKEGDLANIVDGDTGNKWVGTGTGNHVLEFDLKGTYRLDEYQISIPQLAKNFPYYYKIEVWNPDANAWIVIAEYSDRQLGSNTVVAPEGSTLATKVRLTMNTSDEVDSPLTITDFAAYGKALDAITYENLALGVDPDINKTTASDSSESYLTDGDTTTLWKTPWPYNEGYPADVEIDLGRVQYVDNVQVYFEPVAGGRPFQFAVLVERPDGSVVEIYDEYKNHTETLPADSFTIPVQEEVSKVIVSITGTTGKGQAGASTPAMTEVMVMGLPEKDPVITDYSDLVKQKIQEVREYIAGLAYGDTNGKYSQEAKTTLENTLANVEAQLTGGVSSEESTQLQQEIDVALDKFNKEGKVYLNRDLMLLNLVRTKEIIDELKASGKDPDELEAFEILFSIALKAYSDYTIGQAELDAQTNTLAENIKLYEEAPGVVDKTALQAKIAEAEALEEADYTPESFAVLTEKIAKAKAVNDKVEATQRAVNAAVAELNAALNGLILKTAIREFDSEILAKNAKANSEQLPAAGSDGGAAWAFDDEEHWWHSRWGSWDQKGEHEIGQDKGGKPSASNPIWIQTGFDKKWYVSSIEYTGRSNSMGLIQEYTVSVANLTNPTAEPEDSDFKVVKSGTLNPVNTAQTITLDKIVAATHVRITVTDAYDANDGGAGDGHLAAKNIAIFGCDAIEGIDAKLAGYTLSLEGNIGVNFHMLLGEEVLTDANAYMNFTLDGKKYMQIPVKDATTTSKDDITYHVFKCTVPVKDMDTEIKAQIILADGSKGPVYTYTVKEYADSILDGNDEHSEETKALVQAMSDFGDHAATYFEGETVGAAPEVTEEELTDLANHQGTISDDSNDCYFGSSLLLKSNTILRHYFTEKVTEDAVKKGNLYYIQSEGIPAHELGKEIVTEVGGMMITYNPLSYAYIALTRESVDDNLKNVMYAMYLYYQAAQAYVAANQN